MRRKSSHAVSYYYYHLISLLFFLFFTSLSVDDKLSSAAAERGGNFLPRVPVSDEEIRQLIADIWDEERKTKWENLRMNFQGHINPQDPEDQAHERLFQFVDESEVFGDATALKLKELFDNFEPEKGVPEHETAQEREEVEEFLDIVLESNHFRRLIEFLKAKRHPFAATTRIFRKWFKQLWFGLYSREGNYGPADSSAFGHIFVGELDKRKVDGLHNWIRVFTLERNQSEHFDYRGFIVKRANIAGTFKFKWRGDVKPTGSLLLGTSPEFDLALYTLCFLLKRGPNACKFELDECPMSVTSFDMVWRGQVYIGTAFSSPGKMTSQCGNQQQRKNKKSN